MKKVTKKTKGVQKLNAANLQNCLWDTLLEIKAGKISAQNANAIAGQSREISRIVKLQLEQQRISGRKAKKVISLLA